MRNDLTSLGGRLPVSTCTIASSAPCVWLALQVSFFRYMITAIATDQLTPAQCMRHLQLITDIAVNSYGEKRTPWLAVLYDELIRYEIDLRVVCAKMCLLEGKIGVISLESFRQPSTLMNTLAS